MSTLSQLESMQQDQDAVIVESDGFYAVEDEEIAAFHGYQTFLLKASRSGHFPVSGEEFDNLMNYINHLFTEGKIRKSESGQAGFNGIRYAFHNPWCLAGFAVSLMEYIYIFKPAVEQITALFSALSLREMIALFEKAIADFSRIQSIKVQAEISPIGSFPEAVLLLHKKPFYSLVRHPLFAKFMGFSEKWLQETLGIHFDTSGFRRNIEEFYQAIPQQLTGTAMHHGLLYLRFGKYDYSNEAYQKLKDTIKNVAGVSGGSVSEWNCMYASEKWFGELDIGTFVHGVQEYNNRLESVNEDCLTQTMRIFHQVWQIDEKNACSIHMCRSRLNMVRMKMRKIAGQIG